MKYLSCCLLWKLDMNHWNLGWEYVQFWRTLTVSKLLELCCLDGAIPQWSTDWKTCSWQAALLKGRAGWQQLSVSQECVPWKSQGHLTSWGAPNTSPAHQERRLSCSVGVLTHPEYLGRMWMSLNMSREGQPSWWKGWKECLLMSGWELWACLFWRKGGWRETSLLSADIWGEIGERDVLISSPCYAVTGFMWIAHSCIWGGLVYEEAFLYQEGGQTPKQVS